MRKEKLALIFNIIKYCFNIFVIILNILCFFKIKNGDNSLLLICSILNIIMTFIFGSIAFFILIPLILFNWIGSKSLWYSIQISLLYENMLYYLFFVISMPLGTIGLINNKRHNK